MICSMTGFGHAEQSDASRTVSVDIKSVNHRYLDLNIKLPKSLNPLEGEIRELLKSRISRGKIDVFITLSETADGGSTVCYHENIARMYLESFRQMAETFHLKDDVTVSMLASCPDVLEIVPAEANEKQLRPLVMETAEKALNAFIENRKCEGERLSRDLLEKVSLLSSYVGKIEERFPEILLEYQSRLRQKTEELIADGAIDESRIAAEVTLYADRTAIDEELVRLKSHVAEAEKELTEGGCIGRKMDFLAQEMNREANTILSKSVDVTIADLGIEMKTLIEKIREQIQNLE